MNKVMDIIKDVDFLRYGFIVLFCLFLTVNIFLIFYHFSRNKFPYPKFLDKLLLKLSIEGLIIFGLFGIGATIIIPEAKVISPSSPSLDSIEITQEHPFVIEFDRPIDVDLLEKNITPELAGNWVETSRKYIFLTDTLTFIPDKSPEAEKRYTVAFRNIKSIMGAKKTEYLLSFIAPSLPNVKSISPTNGTDGVLVGQEILIETDFAHQNTARLEFIFKPEIEIETVKNNETEYLIKAKNGFKKSTTYTLEVIRTPISRNFSDNKIEDTGESVSIFESTFHTIEAPGVSDYGPKGSGILANNTVWIEFKQDMDKEATENSFSLAPNTAGNITWDSSRKMVFNATSSLSKNTTYTAAVSKNAKASDGSPFENDFNFSFTTIGYVGVSSFYPGNNAYGVSTTANISVTFNQAVDHISAQNCFSISPNPGGSFSWSGNTLIYTHSALGYYTKYTVTILKGVKTIYGLDSAQTYSSYFTTQQQSVMLNVPSYRQAHMYSCMASAARSALAYRGVYLNEDYILSLIGYDSTPFSGTWGDPNSIWGNPYTGIVGNVDGKSGGVNWGYGAYWNPTAKAINNYRATEIKNNWNASGIAQEIANGNPVIVWWVNGIWPAYEVYWKTTSGTPIRGVNSMHVQVVKGFTGTISSPTSFTVTDSGYGYPSHTYDIGTFNAKWSWFGYSAVVVH